jgi:hypothetical protein
MRPDRIKRWLFLYVVVAAISTVLRLPYQPALTAATYAFLLIPLTAIAASLGGWDSGKGIIAWAKAHRVVTALELLALVMLFVLFAFGGLHPVPMVFAELVFVYFFFHAFGAVGEWLLAKLKRDPSKA